MHKYGNRSVLVDWIKIVSYSGVCDVEKLKFLMCREQSAEIGETSRKCSKTEWSITDEEKPTSPIAFLSSETPSRVKLITIHTNQ